MKNEVGGEKERPGQYIDSESPFCRNCTRDDCPTNGDGCKAWDMKDFLVTVGLESNGKIAFAKDDRKKAADMWNRRVNDEM